MERVERFNKRKEILKESKNLILSSQVKGGNIVDYNLLENTSQKLEEIYSTDFNISSIDKSGVEICLSKDSVKRPFLPLPSLAFSPGEVEKEIKVPLGAYIGANVVLPVTPRYLSDRGLSRHASKTTMLV